MDDHAMMGALQEWWHTIEVKANNTFNGWAWEVKGIKENTYLVAQGDTLSGALSILLRRTIQRLVQQ